MDEFLRLGDGFEVGEAEKDEVDEEESDVADISRDALMKHFHGCTGALLVHDDSSGGHEWLTISPLRPQPPEGPEAEEIIRAYGIFSIALLAAEGRAMMLKRFEIPRTKSGPIWTQNREERWTSYTRYASNVVLIWSNEAGARQLDSRWERLDGCLSNLRAV